MQNLSHLQQKLDLVVSSQLVVLVKLLSILLLQVRNSSVVLLRSILFLHLRDLVRSLSVGVEKKVRPTSELLMLVLLSVSSELLVPVSRRIPNTTTDLRSSTVKKTKTSDRSLVQIQVSDSIFNTKVFKVPALKITLKEHLPLIIVIKLVEHMMRQLVVLESYQHLIKPISTTLTSVALLLVKIGVRLKITQTPLVVHLTIRNCIHTIQDSSIKEVSMLDTSIMVGSTKILKIHRRFHSNHLQESSMQCLVPRRCGFHRSQVRVRFSSISPVPPNLSQYSNVRMFLFSSGSGDEGLFGSLQKEQLLFSQVVLQRRVLPKSMLVSVLLLPSLENWSKESDSKKLDLALSVWLVLPPRNSSRILQKVLLFTPYGSYSNFSAAYSEVADKAVLRLSGELVHPDIDYTPHYGIDRNIGIETGFTLSSGGGLNEDGTGGIVTTRFIPDYPALGTIFIEGKAIGRTNGPILTDGTIYILGIGTEAMVLSMMTLELVTSMVSSLVRRNARSCNYRSGSWTLRLYWNCTKQTNQCLWILWRRQRSRHIWYDHDLYRDRSNSLPRSYQRHSSSWYWYILWNSRFQKNQCLRWFWFSLHNRWSCRALWFVQLEQVHCSYLVLMVLQEAYSAQTPENVVTLTLSGDAQETLLYYQRILWYCLRIWRGTYNQNKISCCIWFSSPSRVVQNPSHLLSPPSQFLSALVANLQTDQFRSLDTTETTEIQAHLEQFRLLGNLPIQTSTLLQQSKVQVYSTSLENLLLFTESPQLSLVVLQHYLVLQTYRLPRAQANRHNSSELLGMEKLLSTLYMVTMETTRILVHLVRQQFLVLAIPEKSKYSDITETTEILELQENFNFLPRLLFIHLSITLHLQMVLVYSRLLAVSEFAVFSHQYRRLDPSSVSDRETKHKIYLRRYRKYHNRDVHTNNHRTCTI